MSQSELKIPLEPEEVIRLYEETVEARKNGTGDFITLEEYGKKCGLIVDKEPDLKDLTPEELETYELLKWCDENPDKIVWIDGTDFLEKYSV